MPADDAIKPSVVAALRKDGWRITHDPYRIEFETDNLYADLAAERALVAAEKGVERIAVEIKSFLGASLLREFQLAFGQFLVYRTLMQKVDPDRRLVVAVTDQVYDDLLSRPAIEFVLQERHVPFLVVRLSSEEVVRWTS